MDTSTLPKITLHSTSGGSDKLYQLAIVSTPTANTYNLVYANGPRTGTLTPGKQPKNATPLTLSQANTQLETLKRRQTSRGYHDLGYCSLCAGNQSSPRQPTLSLALTFNQLLARLDQSFEQQRRFMADASHELRTAVSVVRGESEIALSQDGREADDLRESLAIVFVCALFRLGSICRS